MSTAWRFILPFQFITCLLFTSRSSAQLQDGNWHAGIFLNDTLELPFTFTTQSGQIIIRNNDEKIIAEEIVFKEDSVFIRLPVFDAEFRCKYDQDRIDGYFYNHARKVQNTFKFYATRGLGYRFSDKPEKVSKNISGRYHLIFDGEEKESKDAVGIFSQEGNRLTGTILTTTGDYRYLDGEVNGNRIGLSAFDGSHLFLFTAIIKDDSLINGEYFSGLHWHDTWHGRRDNNAALPDAEKLTTVNDSTHPFAFTFPDENGKMISPDDERFKNKPVIIQLMGTWCPNCMDETRFLSDWYNSQPAKDIEVIALDYERIADSTTANNNIRRLKKKFDIRYTVLFAGTSDKKQAALTLPMLSRVFAFPTTIFLTKEKKIFRIYTGFNGPATGEEYTKFIRRFKETAEELKKSE